MLGSRGHQKNKKEKRIERKKERDLAKALKHQPVTQIWEEIGQFSSPSLSLPLGSVFCGLVGRIPERRWNRTRLRAFWFYFCLSVFVFKRNVEVWGLLQAFGLHQTFSSLSFNHRCLMLSFSGSWLGVHGQGEHVPSPHEVCCLVTSCLMPEY